MSRAIATNRLMPFPGETLHSNRFAGWMQYSTILIERAVLVLDDPAAHDLDETFMVSVGTASNSDPAGGGASWHGIMAGFDLTEESSASRVEGLSRISITDFSDPSVDVSFTGIRNQVTGRKLPDMAWNDLGLSGGTFAGAGLKGSSTDRTTRKSAARFSTVAWRGRSAPCGRFTLGQGRLRCPPARARRGLTLLTPLRSPRRRDTGPVALDADLPCLTGSCTRSWRSRSSGSPAPRSRRRTCGQPFLLGRSLPILAALRFARQAGGETGHFRT